MRSGEHSCMAEDKRGHGDLIHSAHAAPNTVCRRACAVQRSNVLTHFFPVCTADISLSYADSS